MSVLIGLGVLSLARKSVFYRPQLIGTRRPYGIEILSFRNAKLKYNN